MEQFYNIAGLITKMYCSGKTAAQALPYLCSPSDNPDIVIPKERLMRTCTDWKHSEMKNDSDETIEYLATGALFYLYLLEHDGLMLHSSAVVVDEKAYLFTADPGTGKSTHTSLWLKHFGDRAFILNDDKPAIRLINGKWYAFGTPWSGKNDISRNIGVELAGIAVIERDSRNSINPFTGVEAIFSILSQVNRTKAPEHRIKVMDLLDSLFEKVPIWKLKCNMDPDAAITAYMAMSGKCRKEQHDEA